MARKYVNPAGSAPAVPVGALDEARAAAKIAADQLREAEDADPGAPGWNELHATAHRAARVATHRVETLERQAAERLERAGKRAAAVKAAAKDLTAMGTALAASRDQVAAAAAEHLRSLAALTVAAAEHNSRMAEARAVLAAKGLQVSGDEDAEHEEGILDAGGLRAAGTDWTPLDAAGVIAHGLRLVFAAAGPAHPFAGIGRYTWRAHEVEHRADGLKVPTLADAGAAAAESPRRARTARPSARSMSAPVEGDAGPVRRGR